MRKPIKVNTTKYDAMRDIVKKVEVFCNESFTKDQYDALLDQKFDLKKPGEIVINYPILRLGPNMALTPELSIDKSVNEIAFQVWTIKTKPEDAMYFDVITDFSGKISDDDSKYDACVAIEVHAPCARAAKALYTFVAYEIFMYVINRNIQLVHRGEIYDPDIIAREEVEKILWKFTLKLNEEIRARLMQEISFTEPFYIPPTGDLGTAAKGYIEYRRKWKETVSTSIEVIPGISTDIFIFRDVNNVNSDTMMKFTRVLPVHLSEEQKTLEKPFFKFPRSMFGDFYFEKSKVYTPDVVSRLTEACSRAYVPRFKLNAT